jgi:biotin carboxyl carrier protein
VKVHDQAGEKMSTAGADPQRVSRAALERGLDELGALVRTDVEPPQFFAAVLKLAVHTARADEAALWLRTGQSAWTVVSLSVTNPEGLPTQSTTTELPAFVSEALAGHEPQLQRATVEGSPLQRLTTPVRQAGQATGALVLLFDGSALPSAPTTLVPFAAAVSEIAGDYLVQHELRGLRRERNERAQRDQWLESIARAPRIAAAADLVVHDGRTLCRVDRLTLIDLRHGRARALAVSGVDQLDPRSSTVQALERLATVVTTSGLVWPNADLEAVVQRAWQELQTTAGTKAAAAYPLSSPTGVLQAVLIGERFETDQTDFTTLQQVTVSLAPLWRAVIAQTHTGWPRRFTQVASRAVWVTVALGLIAAALILIPVEQTVTVEGQLVPRDRRDIFATANGRVEAVHVTHGDRVSAEKLLVELRDPALELETTRVSGELATIRARLGSIKATRLSLPAGAAETAVRSQQLAAEEEDLRQQQTAAERQLTLLTEEQASWKLTSPLDGQVLTWDVEGLLEGRPVERGQILLTVADPRGPWVIEARLRERDLQHLGATGGEAVTCPAPGTTRSLLQGRVERVADVVDVNDRGESTLRVTITIDAGTTITARPGATVWPKIRCGRRALGAVWLGDLIDAVRRQVWRWW